MGIMRHASDPSCLVLLLGGNYLRRHLKVIEVRKSREKGIAGEEMERESRKEKKG